MEKKRIVITGIGVVASNGIGKEEFWANCLSGVSGIKPITLFDTSRYRCHHAGEISNFQPEQYLGSKGLRNLDRTTLLSLVAAKLALDDAHLTIDEHNANDIGIVLGSTMGSVHSISEFDKEGLREGPRYVNPALFPNTVINSPASQVGIWFGLKGLNSTISTGFSASLDAISYAIDILRLDRAQALLVGGVEELCIQTFLGFYKVGLLATFQNGTPPSYAPLAPGSRGTLLGEGAAFFLLESREDAVHRGATIYAEVLGYGSGFEPNSMYRYDPAAGGPVFAMTQALADAGTKADDIGHISACANATKAWDAMELSALRTVFGMRLNAIPVTAEKSLLGESFSAGAALQVASTIGLLAQQGVSQQVLLKQQVCSPVSAGEVRKIESSKMALVDAFGLTGVSSALVLGSV